MRTSAGTLGFVASSSKGSPGASARIVNRTALIPTRTGIEISVRRSRYLDMMLASGRAGARGSSDPWPLSPGLRLFGPVGDGPEVGVPSALGHVAHPVGDRNDARAEDHWDDHDVLGH